MVSQRAWRCRALLQPPLQSHENWLINQACLLWFTSLLTLPPSKNERRCICTVLRHVEHDVPVIITELSVDFVWWTRRSDLHTENFMLYMRHPLPDFPGFFWHLDKTSGLRKLWNLNEMPQIVPDCPRLCDRWIRDPVYGSYEIYMKCQRSLSPISLPS